MTHTSTLTLAKKAEVSMSSANDMEQLELGHAAEGTAAPRRPPQKRGQVWVSNQHCFYMAAKSWSSQDRCGETPGGVPGIQRVRCRHQEAPNIIKNVNDVTKLK